MYFLIRTSKKSVWGGVVFIELAVVLVFLIPLLLLTVDVSYALYEYQTLVKQVRAGARYLSVQPLLVEGDPATTTIKTKANCIVRTADLFCSRPPLLPQLADGSSLTITIKDSQTDPLLKSQVTTSAGSAEFSTAVNLVEVTVTGYVHQLFSGLTTISFSPISAVMRQTN